MEREASSFAISNISLVNNIVEDWDILDEISLKQEVEYGDAVDKPSEEEKQPLIINLEDSCDDISDSIPCEAGSELPEILLESDRTCRIHKGTTTVANSIKKEDTIETEKKMDQEMHGICEKLFVNFQRKNLQQLQKQTHFKGNQSASCSSETKSKKTFERRLNKDMIGHISSKHQIGTEIVQCSSYLQMETQERICGLCLKVCDNFKAIEGDMKDVLDVVLPKIDLGSIQELVVCTQCREVLIKCSAFKTTCRNAYNCIVSFANYRDDVKLNLRDVYVSKNNIVAEDQAICGFCMNPISNCSAISLDVEERDVLLEKMMEQCLPELDLSLIEKPVICELCHDALKNCFHFVTNCLRVEEKIKKYCETHQDINSRGQIELSRLLEFTARDVTTGEVNGNLVDTIKEEKQFYEERGNDDERIIGNGDDVFKFQQITCADGENAAEEDKKKLDGTEVQETFCGENEIYLKEENLFEVENHEFLETKEVAKMETDEPDFIRFEEGLDLPLSEATTIDCKLYKCDFCTYCAGKKDHFLKHLLRHKDPSEVTVYTCDTCSFQTNYKHVLKTHSLVHKNLSEVTVYTCDVCSYQSKYKGDLKKHLLTHNEMDPSEITLYKCHTCSYQSKYKGNITKHLLEKDHSKVGVYKCDICPYQTKQKGGLKQHLLLHKEKGPSKVSGYKCDFCPYRVRQKARMLTHLLGHKDPSEVTMFTCETCSYQSKYKSNLRQHLVTHKDLSEVTVHKCDFCSYQTKRKGGLRQHLLRHKEKDPSKVTVYKCDFCPYRARQKARMLTHLLRHKDPSEVTMFTCDTCSYQSKYKSDLNKHLVTHKDLSEVTVYKCDFCSYQTKVKGGLKQHLLRHKEKDHSKVPVYKYKCDFCPYQAKAKANMLRHLLRHKNPSELTMFTCDTCSYQSKYKDDLIKHLRAHKEMDPSKITVYKCDTCSYQSKYKGTLKRHLLIHKEKDPSEVAVYKFKCDFCPYQARKRDHMLKHLLTHKDPSEVTMFTCDTCSFQSKYKNNLKKHLLGHKDLSEVTVYKCDFCSYQAKRKGSLKTHLLTHNFSQK